MSKESLQFLELIRHFYHKQAVLNTYRITAMCDGCKQIAEQECEVRGEWEYRTCKRCRRVASYRVSKGNH